MGIPVCGTCDKELPNWSANLMVYWPDYSRHIISGLKIICKDCTNKLDDRGVGKQWHNIWELSWVRDNYFFLQASIFEDVLSDSEMRKKWTEEALKDFNALGKLRYESQKVTLN